MVTRAACGSQDDGISRKQLSRGKHCALRGRALFNLTFQYHLSGIKGDNTWEANLVLVFPGCPAFSTSKLVTLAKARANLQDPPFAPHLAYFIMSNHHSSILMLCSSGVNSLIPSLFILTKFANVLDKQIAHRQDKLHADHIFSLLLSNFLSPRNEHLVPVQTGFFRQHGKALLNSLSL